MHHTTYCVFSSSKPVNNRIDNMIHGGMYHTLEHALNLAKQKKTAENLTWVEEYTTGPGYAGYIDVIAKTNLVNVHEVYSA